MARTKNSGKLVGRLVRTETVSDETLREMYSIFERYYRNVTWDGFVRDFREKSRVILLLDRRSKSIQGFTTIKTFKANVDGREVAGLFSGDTVVERDYWGQPALRASFFQAMLITWWENLVESRGRRPFYWFLISKGYKTYLLLTNNFATHWPRFDESMPRHERGVLLAFADQIYPGRVTERSLANFGEAAASSLVLPFDDGAPSLREEIAPIRPDLLMNPKIRFFQSANPGWESGHELCCLAPLSPKIFWSFINRLVCGTAYRAVMRRLGKSDNRKRAREAGLAT